MDQQKMLRLLRLLMKLSGKRWDESKSCKQFKLARIYQIEIIQRDWQYETLHRLPFTDAFRTSAQKPIGIVTTLLSLKAYNLLIEEYPLSKEFITQKEKGYELNIPVAGFNGIGRFVMGLPGEIKISGSKRFKKFLKSERKKFID